MTIHRSEHSRALNAQHLINKSFKQQCQLMLDAIDRNLIPKNHRSANLKQEIQDFLNFNSFVNFSAVAVSNSRYSTVKELGVFRPKFSHSIYDEEKRASLANKNASLLADVFLTLCKRFEGCSRPYLYFITYTQSKADKGDLRPAIQLISDGFNKNRDWLKKSRRYDTPTYDFPTNDGKKAHYLGDEQGLELTNGSDGKQKLIACNPHDYWHAHGHDLIAFDRALNTTEKVVLTRSDVPNMKEYKITTDVATAFFFKRWCRQFPHRIFALQAFKLELVGNTTDDDQSAIDSIRKALVETYKYTQKPDSFGNFKDSKNASNNADTKNVSPNTSNCAQQSDDKPESFTDSNISNIATVSKTRQKHLSRIKTNTSNTARKRWRFKTEIFAESYNALYGRTMHRSHGLFQIAHAFVQSMAKVKMLSACLSANTSNSAHVNVPDLFTKHSIVDYRKESEKPELKNLNTDAMLYFNKTYLSESGLNPAILNGLQIPKMKYNYRCLNGQIVNRSTMFQAVIDSLDFQKPGKCGLLDRLNSYVRFLKDKLTKDEHRFNGAESNSEKEYAQSLIATDRSKLIDVLRVRVAVKNGLTDSGKLKNVVDFDSRIKAIKLFDSLKEASLHYGIDLRSYSSKDPLNRPDFPYFDQAWKAIRALKSAFGDFAFNPYLHWMDDSLCFLMMVYVYLSPEERDFLLWDWTNGDRNILYYKNRWLYEFVHNAPLGWFGHDSLSHPNYTDCVIKSAEQLQNLVNKYWA